MFFPSSVRYAPVSHSAIALGVAAALASFNVHSADAAQGETLEPIVVTATREPQAISRVLADVSVISREDIERQGGGISVVDLLKNLPGFEIGRNGGPASTSSAFLRGAETRHLLVLIDGVRVDTQSGSGGATWEAIPASQIDHIEVVRGPASAVYGSDAIAGVVQVFTRAGQGPAKFDVGVGVGSLGSVSTDAQVSGSSGAWSYSVGVAAERSSGFNSKTNTVAGTRADDDDGYHSSSSSARVGYQFNDHHKVHASVVSQHVNGRYDSLPYSPNTDDHSIHDLNAVSAGWVAQWLDNWRSTLVLGQSTDRYETRPSAYVTRTEVKNASWANQVTLGDQVLRATLEGREDRLLNSTLTTSPDAGKGTRRDGALGLGYDGRLGAWTWQTSVRGDRDSEFGSHMTGSVAAGFAINKQWGLRVSQGTGFRAPTLYQRFTDYGQANLRPEQSQTREVGLTYREGRTSVGVTVFHSHVIDLIQFGDPGVCVDSYGCYRNVSQARLAGVEFNGAVSVSGVNLSGTLSVGSPKNTQTDRLLARRARQHGSVRAETSLAQWLVGVQGQLSGKRYDDASNKNRLPGYAVWGVDAQRQLSNDWKLIVRVDNINDTEYQTARNYASAPRTVFVGLRWTPGL